jgi:predicted DCC family thiol-disulfide oxidoreductase YuxK
LIVLFDGDCAYCNGWVKWITKRDSKKVFEFLPLGSDQGKQLRAQHELPAWIDSVILVDKGVAYTRSSAAWRILSRLPGWGFASLLLRIVPRPLRDLGYDLVTRNRHRLGMKDECELPS